MFQEGTPLLEKMRQVSEFALYFSDSTQVPTSLWVESRICYSKQMLYE